MIMGHYNYFIVVILLMIGFYIVLAQDNLVKKLLGLNIFQTAVFILFISIGERQGATAPILLDNSELSYNNPLPHVLILTAIVVAVATTSLGLALVVRINEAYGSIEEDEIHLQDQDLD